MRRSARAEMRAIALAALARTGRLVPGARTAAGPRRGSGRTATVSTCSGCGYVAAPTRTGTYGCATEGPVAPALRRLRSDARCSAVRA